MVRTTPTMSPKTGTPFMELISSKDRRSLSASLRGNHPVLGATAAFTSAPIDSLTTGEVVNCTSATLRLAEDLFERWNKGLRSDIAQRVSHCYTEDAVLLPTVSNIPRLSRSEIQDYFEHFLHKQPLDQLNQRNVKIGCNKIADAGACTFRIIDAGKTEHVPALRLRLRESRRGVADRPSPFILNA